MGKAKIVNTDKMIHDENLKERLDKLRTDKDLHAIVNEEYAKPPTEGIKFSALKRAVNRKPKKSKAPAIDLEKITVNNYEYKEWLDNLKTLIPSAINRYTFDDPIYQQKLSKSKDLIHALQNTLGFAIRDDYIGGLATVAAISVEHLMSRVPKEEPKKVADSNVSELNDA